MRCYDPNMNIINVPEQNLFCGREQEDRHCITVRCFAVLCLAFLLSLFASQSAYAVPRQIIILRHGEKQDSYRLCNTGQRRSLALRANYLGKDAVQSLFSDGQRPDGFFAITLHSLELISPAAQSWGMPVHVYSFVPLPGLTKERETLALNERTQQAAQTLLNDPLWDGKVVVMSWEHDHIAKAKLEKKFPKERVTLRQLLNLDTLSNVPQTWPDSNYDYFWIVDYENQGSVVPTKFTEIKQKFRAPFETVPSNSWGKPEKLPEGSKCQGAKK